MTKRNRRTLAEYFANGRLPRQEAFSDLIDSMVNLVDDGFEKTPRDGMKIAQLENGSKLISFYDEITVKSPVWSISFSIPEYGGGKSGKNLSFGYGAHNAAGMTLAAVTAEDGADDPAETARVGINNSNPKHALDVNGVVASDGRIGREGGTEHKVRADGEWHPVITGLDGCHAFEIMAGVGKPRSGKYALLHAYALSVFNSRKSSITYHQAHFLSRCDRIDLRWTGSAHNYSLEMRTRCSYEEGASEKIYVRYYLTRLWFDPFMAGSGGPDEAE